MSMEKLKKKKKKIIKDVTVLAWISEGCSPSSKKFLNAHLRFLFGTVLFGSVLRTLAVEVQMLRGLAHKSIFSLLVTLLIFRLKPNLYLPVSSNFIIRNHGHYSNSSSYRTS